MTCFDKTPEQRGGILLPGALRLRLDLKSKDREEAFLHAFELTARIPYGQGNTFSSTVWLEDTERRPMPA